MGVGELHDAADAGDGEPEFEAEREAGHSEQPEGASAAPTTPAPAPARDPLLATSPRRSSSRGRALRKTSEYWANEVRVDVSVCLCVYLRL